MHPSVLKVQFSVNKLQAGDAVRRLCSHSSLPMLTFQLVLVAVTNFDTQSTRNLLAFCLFNLPIWKSSRHAQNSDLVKPLNQAFGFCAIHSSSSFGTSKVYLATTTISLGFMLLTCLLILFPCSGSDILPAILTLQGLLC